ncbi:MAG: hypothetical protein EOO43_05435 [Flavobacterium sp.]|nr:MAG: hypothetical protein EOO43_05435 [Flavobacterium sp.]
MGANEVKKGKKNLKPLYMLMIFLGIFGIFIFGLTRPSTLNKAVEEINASFSKKDVEMVWYKYKLDLYQDEEFLLKIRTRLTDLKLSKSDQKECLSWLPKAPVSLNLIIIPDLSRRIIDTINNPKQINNDKLIIRAAWDSFVKSAKYKEDSKDHFMVDVTDRQQASGAFNKVADNLKYDLSSHKGKSNILFFTQEKTKAFEKGIDKMYEMAKKKPLGADYRYYIRQYLKSRLLESTFFDTYDNKVIIVTDGYLEAENQQADTKLKGFEKELHNAVQMGNVPQIITKNSLNIPTGNIYIPNISILVCEVNERHYFPFTNKLWPGEKYDFEILKAYWEDWFNRMGIQKKFFVPREMSISTTTKTIADFVSE